AEPESWLPHLQAWLRDLARVTVSGAQLGPERLVNFDRRERLAEEARRIRPDAALRLLRAGDRLGEAVADRSNTLLAIEEFLVWWRDPGSMPRSPAGH
ncbi:MAG TPA: hypothetical protein VKA48_11105, partial [Gammaproteobacteria bacterium]|nr:hypothetical protein [Gammaproteobacteria bacterium]